MVVGSHAWITHALKCVATTVGSVLEELLRKKRQTF